MSLREKDIDWDSHLDPPYVELTDEEIEEIENGISLDFIQMEDEEIADLIKKEPKIKDEDKMDKREEILHTIIKDIYGIETKGTVIEPIISSHKDIVVLDEMLNKETHIHGTYDDGRIVSIKITELTELFDIIKMIMN